jgi:hypothetical protein
MEKSSSQVISKNQADVVLTDKQIDLIDALEDWTREKKPDPNDSKLRQKIEENRIEEIGEDGLPVKEKSSEKLTSKVIRQFNKGHVSDKKTAITNYLNESYE